MKMDLANAATLLYTRNYSKVSHFIIAVKEIIKALSTIHGEINRPTPDLEAMERAAKQFKEISHKFACEGVLAPHAYRTKFYDHALSLHREFQQLAVE
jgi:hypothetical protein